MFIKDSGSLKCYLLETVNSVIWSSVVQFLQCSEVSFVNQSRNPNFVIAPKMLLHDIYVEHIVCFVHVIM